MARTGGLSDHDLVLLLVLLGRKPRQLEEFGAGFAPNWVFLEAFADEFEAFGREHVLRIVDGDLGVLADVVERGHAGEVEVGRLAGEELEREAADAPNVRLGCGRLHLDDFGGHPVGRACGGGGEGEVPNSPWRWSEDWEVERTEMPKSAILMLLFLSIRMLSALMSLRVMRDLHM